MKYLLPCPACGNKLAVDISQAGRELTCSCGVAQHVPSLRAIRELEPADEVADGVPQTRQAWSVLRGIVFVLGLVVVFAGFFVAGVGTYRWASVDVPAPLVDDVAETDARIDSLTPLEAFELWTQIRSTGLGSYQPAPRLLATAFKSQVRNVAVTGLVILVLGIVVAVGAVKYPGRDQSSSSTGS